MSSLKAFVGTYSMGEDMLQISVREISAGGQVLLVLFPKSSEDVPPEMVVRFNLKMEEWVLENFPFPMYFVVKSFSNGFKANVLQKVELFPPRNSNDWILVVREFSINNDYFTEIGPDDDSNLLVKIEIWLNKAASYAKVTKDKKITRIKHISKVSPMDQVFENLFNIELAEMKAREVFNLYHDEVWYRNSKYLLSALAQHEGFLF